MKVCVNLNETMAAISPLLSELTKECDGLKKKGGGGGGGGGGESVVLEELQVVRGERDKAVKEVKTFQQDITGLRREKQVRRIVYISP